MNSPRFFTLSFLVLSSLPSLALEPLHYNHPGLTVDLSVGLWADPLPMDFDGDGHFDLLVNCSDKPYNGLYFFRNATGDTATQPFPIFQPAQRIGKAGANVQVSYLNGQPLILTPATTYPDFSAHRTRETAEAAAPR